MANDLSIHAAKSMMQMLSSRTSSEISVKLMKMQSQQDQAIVAMLETQAATFKNAGYDARGSSVSSTATGFMDTTV